MTDAEIDGAHLEINFSAPANEKDDWQAAVQEMIESIQMWHNGPLAARLSGVFLNIIQFISFRGWKRVFRHLL